MQSSVGVGDQSGPPFFFCHSTSPPNWCQDQVTGTSFLILPCAKLFDKPITHNNFHTYSPNSLPTLYSKSNFHKALKIAQDRISGGFWGVTVFGSSLVGGPKVSHVGHASFKLGCHPSLTRGMGSGPYPPQPFLKVASDP